MKINSFVRVLIVSVVFAFALSFVVAMSFSAESQESNPEEVVGDFTIETYAENGKTSMYAYRMVDINGVPTPSNLAMRYYSRIGINYAYSKEKPGYTIKAVHYVGAANDFDAVRVGDPFFSKKLPWGIGLKPGQSAGAITDLGREVVDGYGFASVAEATNFAKKFIAYVTKFPR